METLIKCSIRRYYGAESVEFGAEIMIDLTDPHQKRAAYTKLYLSIDEVHKHYAAELLPKTPNTKPENNGVTLPDGYEYFECDKLVVDTHDGKRTYKIKGGKYSAHGVRVWPETLKKVGIVEIPLEGVSLDGYTAKVKLEGGKAKTVVAIKKNE